MATDFSALNKELNKLEEERSIRLYKDYIKDLLSNVKNDPSNQKITPPELSKNGKLTLIKEPINFIHEFEDCLNSVSKCRERFKKLLDEKNENVIMTDKIKMSDKVGDYWFNTTKNGLNLRPGYKDNVTTNTVPITLENDCVHALCGGRTGSGKSVFLNNVIFSLLAEYPPWELDLFLADFKKVELSRYLSESKMQTPHVNAVAATSEVRYVISLLEYLAACMHEREYFFSLLGVKNIAEFRDYYAKDYGLVLPRVLFLVDEFQQMFNEDSTSGKQKETITSLLSQITKLGRATGYHLMFASQEMTGLDPDMKANFKVGFALACEDEVSSDIIGNSDAQFINEKGIVKANYTSGKAEDNEDYKVPFIPEAYNEEEKKEPYFDSYIKKLCELAEDSNFDNNHKFYQEAFSRDYSELESLLEKIKDTREDILDKNPQFFDVVTLGDSVMFNFKRNDYITTTIEKGVGKNIGVYSTNLDDLPYVAKLLASNLKASPKSDEYEHHAIVRNSIILKKYDTFQKDLDIDDSQISFSNDYFDSFLLTYKLRKNITAIFNKYPVYNTHKEYLIDIAKELFIHIRLQELQSSASEEISDKQQKEIIVSCTNVAMAHIQMFDGCLELEDTMDLHQAMTKEYAKMSKEEAEYFEFFRSSFFDITTKTYMKYCKKTDIDSLFNPNVYWIFGIDMMNDYVKSHARDLSSALSDALNYNMLYIFFAASEFDEFPFIFKTACDYLFLNGDNEKMYDRFNLRYSKKSQKDITIDFLIQSTFAFMPFKKFRTKLADSANYSIDFDKIL